MRSDLEEKVRFLLPESPYLQKKQGWGTLRVCAATKLGAQPRPSMDMKKGLIRIDKDENARITELRKRLVKTQQLIRKHVAPKTSLVDELIAERREAARRE